LQFKTKDGRQKVAAKKEKPAQGKSEDSNMSGGKEMGQMSETALLQGKMERLDGRAECNTR